MGSEPDKSALVTTAATAGGIGGAGVYLILTAVALDSPGLALLGATVAFAAGMVSGAMICLLATRPSDPEEDA